MKKFLISLVMCVCICASFLGLTGCNNIKYSYSDFQTAYANYIADYKNVIFDDDGYVKINYTNATMRTEIESNNFANMFNRLNSNLNNTSSIFEPAFYASQLIIKKYVAINASARIDSNVTAQLYQLLDNLRTKTIAFVNYKVKLDNRENFDATQGLEIYWRNFLFDAYYQMIHASYLLSNAFSDALNNYIFVEGVDDELTGRIARGKLEKTYLQTLNSIGSIYVTSYLQAYYNVSKMVATNDEVIQNDYSSNLRTALKHYNTAKDKFSIFDNGTGVMNTAESRVVTDYKQVLQYKSVYELGVNMVNDTILSSEFSGLINNIKSGQSLTPEHEEILTLWGEFFNNEYAIMTLNLQVFGVNLSNI